MKSQNSSQPTEKGLELLKAIYDSEYQDTFGSATIDNPVWKWSVTELFGASAGGIIARLLEQGYVGVSNEGDIEVRVIWLTASGYLALCTSAAADYTGEAEVASHEEREVK